jgi:hypothetical protein
MVRLLYLRLTRYVLGFRLKQIIVDNLFEFSANSAHSSKASPLRMICGNCFGRAKAFWVFCYKLLLTTPIERPDGDTWID